MSTPKQTTLCVSPKLRIEATLEENQILIRPVGTIDEDADLGVILTHIKDAAPHLKPSIIFDLGQVARINSIGVREWVLLMDRLAMPCSFVNVNEVFLDQVNIVPDLIGKRRMPVKSFYVPHICTRCKQTSQVLVQASQVSWQGEQPSLPSFDCQKCSSPLEMDWVDDDYFTFLQRQKQLA